MLKNAVVLSLVFLVGAFALCGCFSHQHTIGSGFHQSSEEMVYHQWYLFWGLWKLGDGKDGGALADTNNNYRITTQFSAVDSLITIFSAGIASRNSVYIEK